MPTDTKMDYKDRSKVIDINDKGLFTGETVELDFSSDAWAFPAPPPMGLYDLKLFPAKDCFKMNLRDETKGWDSPGNVYYSANLECRIVAPGQEWDNTPVFVTVNTQLYRGRELSSMMGVVLLTGAKPKKNSLSDLEQAKILNQVLKGEPIIRKVLLDWQGYSKNDEKVVCKSMIDFPKNQDGTYSHSFTRVDAQRDKEEIVAQLRVKQWVAKDAPMVSQPKAPTAQVVAPVAAPAPSVSPVTVTPDVDSELENLLA
jgi:hypothetical protein